MLSDQLRQAVMEGKLSVYAVAKEAGIPEPSLHRFIHGTRGLTLDTADKLAAYFSMRLTRPVKPKRPK